MTSAPIVNSRAIAWNRERLDACLELTKPRLTMLAVLTTVVGFVMGATQPFQGWMLAATAVGAALVGGGANALNQWLERDADALMRRTQCRPLPTGRLRPSQALLFGLTLSLAGVLLLHRCVNALAAQLALLTLISYVGMYTPLKRKTALCTLVGAVPGALPPMIGWAAARGTIEGEAWVLFALLFVWQLPHFLALAWAHRDDYARAGFQMLPVVEPDGASTARQMVLYSAALLPISLLPTMVNLAGPWYFLGAVVAGLWFSWVAIAAARHLSETLTQRLFLASVQYLPLVLLLMVLDKARL